MPPPSLTNRTQPLAPSKMPPTPTFSLEAADILALVDPYCRALAAQRDTPFFEFVLDLLHDVPDSVRPRANALAQQMLISEAFRQLDSRAKLESDILTQLLELPGQISQSLAVDSAKKAAEMWNVLFPRLQAELQAQTAPQMQLLQSLLGGQETPWSSLPRGRERLTLVLETCRARVAERFPQERPEQFAWLASWADEMLWAWRSAEEAIEGGRDLFAADQQHLLTRVLRAIYHPKCPSPGLPLSEALQHEAFLPLYLEAQATQSALDGLMRNRLDAVPILPQVGDRFSPERHTAPRTFWRTAQSEREKPDTVYEVREIGLERHGQVMIKATVGIVEASTPEPAPIHDRSGEGSGEANVSITEGVAASVPLGVSQSRPDPPLASPPPPTIPLLVPNPVIPEVTEPEESLWSKP